MLEIKSNVQTNTWKHVTSNTAHASSQQYTKGLVWLVQITFCVMTLCKFLLLVRPNVISDGPTNGLLIYVSFKHYPHSERHVNTFSIAVVPGRVCWGVVSRLACTPCTPPSYSRRSPSDAESRTLAGSAAENNQHGLHTLAGSAAENNQHGLHTLAVSAAENNQHGLQVVFF